MKGKRCKRKMVGAIIILSLLFSTIAILTPQATPYAYTHTVFGESSTATW